MSDLRYFHIFLLHISRLHGPHILKKNVRVFLTCLTGFNACRLKVAQRDELMRVKSCCFCELVHHVNVCVCQRLYGSDNGEDQLYSALSVAVDRQGQSSITQLHGAVSMLFHTTLLFTFVSRRNSPSSVRQHLNCDVCLNDKSGRLSELFCVILCAAVVTVISTFYDVTVLLCGLFLAIIHQSSLPGCFLAVHVFICVRSYTKCLWTRYATNQRCTDKAL